MSRALTIGKEMPRFGLLLVAMFLELLLSPVLTASPIGLMGARIVTSLVLLAALLVVGADRLSLGLFAAAFGAHLVSVFVGGETIVRVSTILRLFFLCYAFALILRHVLRDRNVSYDTIAGAACGYMLLGLIWGDLFMIVEQWLPGSYTLPDSFALGSTADTRAALMYFSFVTLTTVGYGFIHPNNPGSGGIAVSEAVVGQLYLAVTVSRLVGLHISSRS